VVISLSLVLVYAAVTLRVAVRHPGPPQQQPPPLPQADTPLPSRTTPPQQQPPLPQAPQIPELPQPPEPNADDEANQPFGPTLAEPREDPLEPQPRDPEIDAVPDKLPEPAAPTTAATEAEAEAAAAMAAFQRREKLYRANLLAQHRFREGANLREYTESKTMWYLYEPAYPCPFPERIGEFGNHAKWMCNLEETVPKDESCVLLSFGLASDTTWEHEMRLLRPKCEIHGYDPTPAARDIMTRDAKEIGIVYHEMGLCGEPSSTETTTPPTHKWNGNCQTLPEIVESLGKDHIDVLKIDIDGLEFDAVDAAWNGPKGCAGMVPVGQVEMEIHHMWLREENRDPPVAFIKLMDTMERCGFRLFSKEPNLLPGHTDTIEVSWVHESRVGLVPSRFKNNDDDDA